MEEKRKKEGYWCKCQNKYLIISKYVNSVIYQLHSSSLKEKQVQNLRGLCIVYLPIHWHSFLGLGFLHNMPMMHLLVKLYSSCWNGSCPYSALTLPVTIVICRAFQYKARGCYRPQKFMTWRKKLIV